MQVKLLHKAGYELVHMLMANDRGELDSLGARLISDKEEIAIHAKCNGEYFYWTPRGSSQHPYYWCSAIGGDDCIFIPEAI